MLPSDSSYEQDLDASAPSLPRFRMTRRRLWVGGAVLMLLILGFLPPFINVNRYRQRIASNIGASLGRPVHFKSVTLSMFPMPGFTLEDFVVEEDPAFGSEPVLQADEVHATVRLSSLWGRRVEFSTISLTDPSVNLVHTADGFWNLQGVLLQASRIQAAPTDQRRAGPAPRFPYIEATGARLNLKLGEEKTPYSLTEADFALWLPEPNQWHFRLEARPVRTDIAPADAGILRLEGTLGNGDARAATLAGVPIDLHGNWQDAQLAGLSRLLLGSDAGLRGTLNLDVNALGNLGHAVITSHIQLARGRRADFVPPDLLSIEASCQATAENAFHDFSAIECHWPPPDSPNPSVLIVTAAVPDIYNPAMSSASITLPALRVSTFLDWLRVATPHPPTGLTGSGALAGSLVWHGSESDPVKIEAHPGQKSSQPTPAWSGELELSGESLQTAALGADPIPLGDILLRSMPAPATTSQIAGAGSGFYLEPVSLSLGGKQPATLEGHFDASGYTLHLSGNAIPARLLGLADAIPQFGDGLRQLIAPPSSDAAQPAESSAAPISFDLTATRPWGGQQIWRATQTTPAPAHHHPAR